MEPATHPRVLVVDPAEVEEPFLSAYLAEAGYRVDPECCCEAAHIRIVEAVKARDLYAAFVVSLDFPRGPCDWLPENIVNSVRPMHPDTPAVCYSRDLDLLARMERNGLIYPYRLLLRAEDKEADFPRRVHETLVTALSESAPTSLG